MQHKISLKKFTGKVSTSLILALMLTSLSGCGEAAREVTPPAVEPIASEAPSDENTDAAPTDDGQDDEQNTESTSEETPSQGSDNGQNGGGDSAPQNNFAPQSDTELDGNVKSIGNDSFVVSQNFSLPSDSEGSELIVSPAEGSEDEVLITVHVSEDTLYRIHTVKNGGVNGDADVEKTDGSFADIQEKISVIAHGYYKDSDFWADEIIIYRFV